MKTAEKAGRLFLTLFGIAGLLFLILSRTGISTDVVLSGSMEPGIRTGGLVFTDTRRREPQTGDIITYRLRDVRITHRVVRREGTVLITKGDANEGEDPLPVEAEQVLGTVIFHTVCRISGDFYEAENNSGHTDSNDRSGNFFLYPK